MFDVALVNPDESLFASIAWTLWTEGFLGTELLAGAIPGIENRVYWTPPLYYVALSGWLGTWGLSLLSVRSLSIAFYILTLALQAMAARRVGFRHVWVPSVVLLADPVLAKVGVLGRMDMMAIALSVATLTVASAYPKGSKGPALGGVLGAACVLTHPLGLAAAIAAALESALAGRRQLLAYIGGFLPGILVWGLYILQAPGDFSEQMSLQLQRKADYPWTLLESLGRQLVHYGSYRYLAPTLWIAGVVGLSLYWRRVRPWAVAAALSWPAVWFSGELGYTAYLVPYTAMGVHGLLSTIRWGHWVAAVSLAAYLIALVVSWPPLGRIDPEYESYCDRYSAGLPPRSKVILAVLPDPWFGLRKRRDLHLQHASPVPLSRRRLIDYYTSADFVIAGGYNVPGLFPSGDEAGTVEKGLVLEWNDIASEGQTLWILWEGTLLEIVEVDTTHFDD